MDTKAARPPSAVARSIDELCALKNFEVLGNRRETHMEWLRELADGRLA
jgi:hypothetical protein